MNKAVYFVLLRTHHVCVIRHHLEFCRLHAVINAVQQVRIEAVAVVKAAKVLNEILQTHASALERKKREVEKIIEPNLKASLKKNSP